VGALIMKKTIFDLIDEYCDNDVKNVFNDARIWKAARDKVEEVKKNDKADGGVDIAKLYSQGCTKDF
jgi:hypothetical protein